MNVHSDERYGHRIVFHAHIPRPGGAAGPVGEPALVASPSSATGGRELGEPFARPVTLPAASLAPRGDARLLRRLRHVVRRRVRVDLDGLTAGAATDGEISITLRTVSARDPRVLAWTADRLVAVVVLHDGCGARVIGGGGLMGRLELPSATCAGAYLAFCYDAEAAASLS